MDDDNYKNLRAQLRSGINENPQTGYDVNENEKETNQHASIFLLGYLFFITILITVALIIASLTGCTEKIKPIAYHCPQLVLPAKTPSMPPLSSKSSADQVVKFYVGNLYNCTAWSNAVYAQVKTSY